VRSRSRRRIAAAAVGVALATGFLAPTNAQTSSNEPSCPDPVENVSAEMRFDRVRPAVDERGASSDQPINAVFTYTRQPSVPGRQSRINSIAARVYACGPAQITPQPDSMDVPGNGDTDLSVDWTPTFETNGTYAVQLLAYGERPEATTTVEQRSEVVFHFVMAVPPRAPTGVRTSQSKGVVTVAWSNADREKDLIAYEVRRARQGSTEFATVKNGLVAPDVSSVTDTPPEGTWRYHVIAYRPEVEQGSRSSDVTTEVSAPAPAATTATSGGAGPTSGSNPDGTRTTAGSTGSATTVSGGAGGAGAGPTSGGASPGGVDLSNFAAALNARRSTPAGRVEPPDPGFQETLPFRVPTTDGLAAGEEDPAELGGDEPNVGVGQGLASDPGERRRSLGFVAFGLLLFVLSMTGLFVKGEVARADELDLQTLEGADDEPAEASPERPTRRALREAARAEQAASAAAPAVAAVTAVSAVTAVTAAPVARVRRRARPVTSTSTATTDAPTVDVAAHDRFADLVEPAPPPGATNGSPQPHARRRRTAMPLDAPGLDVPDPVFRATPARARRTPTPRLPARPAPATRPKAKATTTTVRRSTARRS
jgi:hypothetical protein